MKSILNIKSLAISVTAALLMSFNVAAAPDSQQQASTGEKKVINLGGGFIAGMNPTQTCLFFKEKYRSKNAYNHLCRLVDRRDFSNLTVVNHGITNGNKRIQHITNIAFFFDENEELKSVMSVLDASYDNGQKREIRREHGFVMRRHMY